ncbi:hypothetical protein DPMN_091445, partial [Dreissena polymorpha]
MEDATETPQEEVNPYEFPVTNLYELEGRVFAEHWSIPYKKEESLGKCLISAANLAEAGLMDNDENCTRFVERVMTESFQKLLTSNAVHRWSTDIQEGIYNMLQLLVDLVAARLQHMPVHLTLMDVLAMALNPDCEFQYKNKSRRDRTAWEEKLEDGVLYTAAPANRTDQLYGWLTGLVNRFAMKGGFEHIRRILESDDLDAPSIAALMKPLGMCSEYLNVELVRKILTMGMEKSINYVKNLEEKDFKEKKVGSVSDLLTSMKLLCIHIWPTDTVSLDNLRLDVALRMLKSPHFNAKMNSLKEVAKLIEDATSVKNSRTKSPIPVETIQAWLLENRVLSIALEGNIDQAQYCDKIKGIVDFLGTDLSSDELTSIWKMQAKKLLNLIGKIGRDAKIPKTTNQLLWDLSHLPALSTHLIELAMEEHLAILNDSYTVKDQVKRNYLSKCVDDIKKGVCVLPTLKQLHQLSKNILKHSHKQDKSLVKCHKQALMSCGDGQLEQTTLVDARYPHSEFSPVIPVLSILTCRSCPVQYVSSHLSFLQYVLQDGVLYLPWNRAREIWSTLVAAPEACTLHWAVKVSFGAVIVEKTDLLGLDFLWQLCLNTPDETIASLAIQLLLNVSYTNLASRLKKDAINLHKKFIHECKTRLE